MAGEAPEKVMEERRPREVRSRVTVETKRSKKAQ